MSVEKTKQLIHTTLLDNLFKKWQLFMKSR